MRHYESPSWDSAWRTRIVPGACGECFVGRIGAVVAELIVRKCSGHSCWRTVVYEHLEIQRSAIACYVNTAIVVSVEGETSTEEQERKCWKRNLGFIGQCWGSEITSGSRHARRAEGEADQSVGKRTGSETAPRCSFCIHLPTNESRRLSFSKR